MSTTVIGIIVAISMVVCGLGSYFIGRTAGMEWVLEHTMIEVMKESEHTMIEVMEEDDDEAD